MSLKGGDNHVEDGQIGAYDLPERAKIGEVKRCRSVNPERDSGKHSRCAFADCNRPSQYSGASRNGQKNHRKSQKESR